MVALACAAAASGETGPYEPPADDQVRRYQERMHLPDVILGVSNLWPAHRTVVREQNRSDVLSELVWFDIAGHSDPGRLAHERLVETPEPVRHALYQCLIEACSNVIEHAETGRGFAAAQVYSNGVGRRRIVIGIGDVGLGVRAALARVGTHTASDGEALKLVLAGGTTSAPMDLGRGFGIFHMARAVRLAGGRMLIRTGLGSAHVHGEMPVVNAVPYFPGTLVGVDLPCG
jgi:hypothetical protein